MKTFKKSYYTSNHVILCAQPTPASHPHLIKHGEITRGLSAEVYDSRRNKLLKMIKENINDTNESNFHHLMIIPSSSVVYMSGHIPYPFRQFTEFNYLCGYNEANCILVLRTVMQRNDYESVLFIPKPTATSMRWEGPKMSLEEVKKFLGVDKTHYTEELEDYLQSYAKSVGRFTLWYDFSSSNSRLFNETMRSFIQAHLNCLSLESPKIFLHKSRLLKCAFEAELMRKTCEIGAKSMREVIRFSEPFILESHLQAKMEYECRIRGADQPAFPPVVAGGSRANTIHYIDNNQIVKDNEMVLMDAGNYFTY